MTESALGGVPVSLIPARPLDEEEQSAKLQRMGLDFLSSIHWIVIVVVALLFAAFVVLLKRHRDSESVRQVTEAEQMIEAGRQRLLNNYFLPDGRVNTGLFPTPRHSQADSEETFAQDAVNDKLNSGASQTILSQLRRYAKSGKLFSFFQSAATANDTVASLVQRRAANKTAMLDEDQKLARSLLVRYGGDQLRNPLINKQIDDEIAYRKESREADEVATAKPVTTLATPVGEQKPTMDRLNERQLEVLDAAFAGE